MKFMKNPPIPPYWSTEETPLFPIDEKTPLFTVLFCFTSNTSYEYVNTIITWEFVFREGQVLVPLRSASGG